MKNKNAFTLIELSIVLLVIGIIVSAVVGGKKLIQLSNLTKARELTNSSPVSGIENLTLWMETTSSASYGNVIPNDGDLVANWYDINPQLTNRKAFFAEFGAPLPYTAKAINGLPAILISAAGGFISSANYLGGDISSINEATVFIVSKPIASGNTVQYTSIFFNPGNASNMFGIFTPLVDGSGNASIYWSFGDCCNSGSRLIVSAPAGFMGAPSIVSTIVRTDGSADITVNNTVLGTATFNSPLSMTVSNAIGIGVDNFNGYIGEVIVYARGLSAAERLAITQYLSKKWGITIS